MLVAREYTEVSRHPWRFVYLVATALFKKRITAPRMAFTSADPSERPNQQGGRNDDTGRRLVTQAVWLWLGGVVVISVVILAIMVHTVSNRPAEGSVTVGEAIAGTQAADESDSEADEHEDSQQYPGYRLVELAAALGLPNGAAPEGAFEMGMSHDQARLYLMDLVNQAVTQGDLSPTEADGVMKAFEAGLVSPPVNITGDDAEDNAGAEDNSGSSFSSGIGSSE